MDLFSLIATISDFLQSNPRVLPLIFISVIFCWSLAFSATKPNEGFRSLVIVGLSLVFYLVALYSDDIFQKNNEIYGLLFTNFSTELFGFLIVYIVIFELLKENEGTLFLGGVVSVIVLWFSIQLLEPQKILPLPQMTMIFITEGVVFNLGIELFAGSVLCLIIFSRRVFVWPMEVNGTVRTPKPLWYLLRGATLIMTSVVIIMINRPCLLNKDMISQIGIAFLGVIMTYFALLEWKKLLTPSQFPNLVLIYVVSSGIIYSNYFGEALSVSLGAEFFGALLCTILSDGRWVNEVSWKKQQETV